jgi:mRNA interferase HicA
MFSCDAVGCHPLAPAEDGRPRLRQDQLLSLWKFYNDGGAITPKLDATLMLFNTTQLLYRLLVTSNQFKRWLKQNGCTFTPGHGGHLIVRRGDRTSVLPMHGSGKELGTGLVQKIKKDLGLR